MNFRKYPRNSRTYMEIKIGNWKYALINFLKDLSSLILREDLTVIYSWISKYESRIKTRATNVKTKTYNGGPIVTLGRFMISSHDFPFTRIEQVLAEGWRTLTSKIQTFMLNEVIITHSNVYKYRFSLYSMNCYNSNTFSSNAEHFRKKILFFNSIIITVLYKLRRRKIIMIRGIIIVSIYCFNLRL